jgi:hypothetical protein
MFIYRLSVYTGIVRSSGDFMMRKTVTAGSAVFCCGLLLCGFGISQGSVDSFVVTGKGGHILHGSDSGPESSSGNYWSACNGSDLNRDGIGDTVDGARENIPFNRPYGLLDEPLLLVTIKGGIGITASVENRGNWDAIRVDWLFTMLGGHFVASSIRYQSGTIPLVSPGQELVVVRTRHLFGVGLTNVIVNVGKATAFQRGFLLGVFYLPLPPA